MLTEIKADWMRPYGGKLGDPITLGPLTVFVGPNGCGKSKALRSAWGKCTEFRFFFRGTSNGGVRLFYHTEEARIENIEHGWNRDAFHAVFRRIFPCVKFWENRSVGESLMEVIHSLTLQNHPEVLIIENLGDGLHPYSQRELGKFLQESASKGVQIIAATHNPCILKSFAPESLRLMAVDSDGNTVVAKLSDYKQGEYLDWVRPVLDVGEMWIAFGEDWLLQKPEEH